MWPLIAAAAGAVIGGISTASRSRKEQEKIDQQQRMAEDAYWYKTQYDNASFALQRGEALETLGIQKNRLGEALGMDVNAFNLGLEGQALENRAARVSLADNTGMALAQEGMSGVKGSGALGMRLGFQEDLFGRQIDLQERGNSASLQNMVTQYSNQFDDIGREIGSWNPGGYRYEAKGLSDLYAKQMHGLELQGYANAKEDARATGLDYLYGMLGGIQTGLGLGRSIQGLRDQQQR